MSGKGSPTNSNKSSATTFHYAARDGKLRVIEDLFAHSSPEIHNINIPTSDGSTALHFAAQYGHLEVCEYLLRHRADFAIKANNGETALDRAINDKRRRCIKLLEEQVAAKARLDGKAALLDAKQAGGSAKKVAAGGKQRVRGKSPTRMMGAGTSVPFV